MSGRKNCEDCGVDLRGGWKSRCEDCDEKALARMIKLMFAPNKQREET